MKYALWITVVWLGVAGPLAAGQIPDRLVVFGDSLSDTGNLDQGGLVGDLIAAFANVGPTGTFSNGPVWHDYMADGLGIPRSEPSRDGGGNYAFGGADTDRGGVIEGFLADLLLGQQTGIEEQIEIYVADLPAGGANANDLHVLWGGGNDLRGETNSGVVPAIVNNMEQRVRELVAAGAAKLLVPNLPNLGRTPESIQQGADAVALAESLSMAFNAALQSTLDTLATELVVDLRMLDVFAILEEVVQQPQAFGLNNVTDPCPDPDSACAGFLFWDLIHPTTAAHNVLGRHALAVLAGPPQGDLDCDGDVDFDDIEQWVLALADRVAYETQFQILPEFKADVDGDGDLDFDDIDDFVAILSHPSPSIAGQHVPEPSSGLMAALAACVLLTLAWLKPATGDQQQETSNSGRDAPGCRATSGNDLLQPINHFATLVGDHRAQLCRVHADPEPSHRTVSHRREKIVFV